MVADRSPLNGGCAQIMPSRSAPSSNVWTKTPLNVFSDFGKRSPGFSTFRKNWLCLGFIPLFAANIFKPAEQPPASSPDLIALGKQVYTQQWAACHGTQGLGDGEAAY